MEKKLENYYLKQQQYSNLKQISSQNLKTLGKKIRFHDIQIKKDDFMQLEMATLFQIFKFTPFSYRIKIISNNKMLNYISIDSNKILQFNIQNYDTLIKLIEKIRSLNQKNDYIEIQIHRQLDFKLIDKIMNIVIQKGIIALNIDQSFNDILDDSRILKSFYAFRNLKFLTLNFDGNNITKEGIIILTKALSNMQQLNKFVMDIFDNNIQDNGCEQLAQSLLKLQNLQTLILDLQYFYQFRQIKQNH